MSNIKAAILLAEGFEEIEAITPKDVLNRAGITCDLISINSDNLVTGTNGVTIKTDGILEEHSMMEEYSMIILPGGMPGAKYLSENEKVLSIIRSFNAEKKFIAAICASPALVLSKAGIADGKAVTCYPGMESFLNEANTKDELVIIDENIITSRGPATALEFSYKLVDVLLGTSKNQRSGMLYNYLVEKLTN